MFIRDGDDKVQRQLFNRRSLLVGLAQMAGFGVIGTRLFQLQVVEGARYAPLAEDNRLDVQMLAPARGRIFDRFGELLAANKDGYRAVLVPSQVRDVRGVVTLFSRIVPVPPEEQERLVQRARRQAPTAPIVLASDLTYEQIAEINLFAPQLAGRPDRDRQPSPLLPRRHRRACRRPCRRNRSHRTR